LGLRFLEFDFNALIILFKLNFFAKTLMTFSRYEQMNSSFWNIREPILSLCIGFRTVRDNTMELAGFEGERQTRLADNFSGFGLFYHDVETELGSWRLLRRVANHAGK